MQNGDKYFRYTAPDDQEKVYELYVRYYAEFDASSTLTLTNNCIDLIGTPTFDP